MLPTKTLACRKGAAAPGYKRSKDRLTVSLCGNAAGMHKLPKLPIKVLLVLDNVPSHPSEEELKDGNIEAMFLPSNMTALKQSMDQIKRRYRRKLLTALSEEDGKNASVIDLLKQINIKDVVYMIAEPWLELPESTLVKLRPKIWSSNQTVEEEAVFFTEITTAIFLSAFKDLDECQDVDTEDVEQ
ncbi:hypothetical protein AVEN_252217-1 [Araneus ventricosus]|uniref:DDE-1 domain-containing protein n=1 Tax=Araneus ventricosus TaxID=182803 RepID=A0A4Y2T8Z3_ARAVE|nr:hypothetical protein AVEN_153519-1 [Araneus ventricosus]GBN97015.1 hypothetical protein AVEN_88252-1 [Araneus ventricosus]GBN97047.1 hypothetical protein AVEN_177355-1 [Araneus ventricosus]GBN97108.1 hypothetical protein AVEN_252217-1 [Araneus ventricosus]